MPSGYLLFKQQRFKTLNFKINWHSCVSAQLLLFARSLTYCINNRKWFMFSACSYKLQKISTVVDNCAINVADLMLVLLRIQLTYRTKYMTSNYPWENQS